MPEIDVDFQDSRISMCHWWPLVESIDIPKPETTLVPLEDVMGEGETKEADIQPVIDAAQSLDAEQYFLRGDMKSADVLVEGAFLNSLDDEPVEYTMRCLLSSMLTGSHPSAAIAVREQLDLDIRGSSYGGPVAPEVRVFIDNGEVLCHHCRVTEDELDHSTDPEILTEMHELIEDEWDEKILPHAETAANAMNENGWSIDFIRGEDGVWYFTDAALYGLYYRDMGKKESKWVEISHHDSDCEYNLAENPPENLPETPENARTEREIKPFDDE